MCEFLSWWFFSITLNVENEQTARKPISNGCSTKEVEAYGGMQSRQHQKLQKYQKIY